MVEEKRDQTAVTWKEKKKKKEGKMGGMGHEYTLFEPEKKK